MKTFLLFLFAALSVIAADQPERGACSASMRTGSIALMNNVCPPRTGPSPAVAYLVSCKTNISQRVYLIHSLGGDLSLSDITALYVFLKSPPELHEANMGALHFIKNEIFTALRNQTTPPPGFTDVLSFISQDARQDIVTRDYAIQHLTSWCEHGLRDAPNAKERVRTVLMETAKENNSIAGTALLGMHHLVIYDSAFKPGDIKSVALGIVQSPEANLAARITAIQVCAEQSITEAIPAIEAFAQKQGQTSLQMSAISALGRLGGPEQSVLLRTLPQKDPALRPVVMAALKQLERTMASRQPF
jgi:hypothetical protein